MTPGHHTHEARQGYLPIGPARLFYRDIGEGRPIVVLHGGPDLDHNYLLPEMDGLADGSRLIFYDQRGRGRSAAGVKPEDVTITSEVEDLDELRRRLQLESFAVLGHSWGGVLAMEYAVRHPDRVSHLILMNSAPASHRDWLLVKEHLRNLRSPRDLERMQQISSSPEFRSGDLTVEAEGYRIHFRPAVSRPEVVEQVVGRLRVHFDEETVLLARSIEQRLYEQTWLREDYDLLTALGSSRLSTLVIHGDHDFIAVEAAAHIAEAIPDARLVVLPACGHFAYLEAPEAVHAHVSDFVRDAPWPPA